MSIEVSSSDGGLNSAIEATRDGGRVVVGSWFGSKTVELSCLGGRFHRSHMTLVASQVSHIPAPLTARWTKQRRFDLVWRLLKEIKPSKLVDVVAHVSKAPEIYARLDANPSEILQPLFTYDDEASE